MKSLILIVSLYFYSSLSDSFAQVLNESETSSQLCNGKLDNDPDLGGCVDNIQSTTTTINGSLGNDDGSDFYAFPLNLSGTLTFTFSTSPTFPLKLQVYEYSGTIGVDGAETNPSTPISSGGNFTFVSSKKYVLYVENPDGGFSTKSYTINIGGALPVQLVSFSGKVLDGGISLTWKTAQEKNSKIFEIQRSTDALNYTSIAKINAFGDSKTEKSYQFYDGNPIEGINYYQLKQIDNDNSFTIFRPISVIYVLSEKDLVLYPNPSTKTLKLPIDFIQNATKIMIYNANGIFQKEFTVSDIENRQINIEQLKAGHYIIQAQSDLQVLTKKFMKAD
jgi:hypothetical protein